MAGEKCWLQTRPDGAAIKKRPWLTQGSAAHAAVQGKQISQEQLRVRQQPWILYFKMTSLGEAIKKYSE